MREAIATAFDENLDSALERERPIDRIAALGFTDSLGSDLLRARDGLQREALRRVMLLLVKRASEKFRNNKTRCERGMVEKLAIQAIKELVLPVCRTCNGTKERMNEDLKVVCPSCNGSGAHRYSDKERALSLGMTLEIYQKGWGKRLAMIQSLLNGSDTVAIRSVRYQLERE